MNRTTFNSLGDIRPARVVLVGLALSALALAIDWALLAGGTAATFAVASLLNIVPVVIALPALLALRPEARASAPAGAPALA